MGKGEVQYAPCKLLSIENGLAKRVLARIRAPNLLDNGSLLGTISDVDLISISIIETEPRARQVRRV